MSAAISNLPPDCPSGLALAAEWNVRLFSCDNAASFTAAAAFLGGAEQAQFLPYAVVIENVGSPLPDFIPDMDAHPERFFHASANGTRLFAQGNAFSIRELARRLPPGLAVQIDAALDAFLGLGSATPPPTQVMGILNVTPDSFSDGGQWGGSQRVEAAVERAMEMEAQGASIIDIGGESSRPGAADVPADEELRRVLPVLQRLRPHTRAKLSIDTRKASVARACLAAGADMINDVSGLTHDPALAGVVARFPQAELVLMHQRRPPATETYSTEYTVSGVPVYEDVVADTMRWLRTQAALAVEAGVRPGQLWIDPGYGFGKTYGQNVELLRRIREYTSMGLPVLLGVSRKSSIGRMQGGGEPDDRLEGSLAAAAWAISQGVRAVRVHDVRETARVTRVADRLRPNAL